MMVTFDFFDAIEIKGSGITDGAYAPWHGSYLQAWWNRRNLLHSSNMSHPSLRIQSKQSKEEKKAAI